MTSNSLKFHIQHGDGYIGVVIFVCLSHQCYWIQRH